MDNWQQTLVSQYANTNVMYSLIQSFNDWVDPAHDLDAFHRCIWELNTAEGYGLDVWGRIVGISRNLILTDPVTYLGFKDGVSDFGTFNNNVFFDNLTLTKTFSMSDDAYRAMIFIKAASNISNCSAPSINYLLSRIFVNRGLSYVQDHGDMSMTYVFEFFLHAFEVAILTQSNALPRPSGVKLFVLQIPISSALGFKEMGAGAQPFNQAPFQTAIRLYSSGNIGKLA